MSVTANPSSLRPEITRNIPKTLQLPLCSSLRSLRPLRLCVEILMFFATFALCLSSPEPFASESGTGAERLQLGDREVAVHRRHAAIGAGGDVFPGHVLRRFGDQGGNLFGRLD